MSGTPELAERKGLEKIWERYIYKEELELAGVKDFIASSWHRCKQASVNPSGGTCTRVYSNDYLQQIKEANKLLIDITEPVLESLYDKIQGSGFMLVFTTSEGVILKTMGDYRALDRAGYLNFYKGAQWTEESVGTNAIGTCLATGMPVQVSGAEHFCSNHHTWTCSAAPVRDNTGQVAACLDISGPYEKMHPHTLGIVAAAARAIEEQLHKELYKIELNRYWAASNSVSEGILFVNSSGNIENANPSACSITGQTLARLKGKGAIQILGTENKLQEALAEGRALEKEEFHIKTPLGTACCPGKIVPVGESGQGGAIIIFREKQPASASVASSLNGSSRQKNDKAQSSPNAASFTFQDIIGRSPRIREAVELARRVAACSASALLLGESGTGKEVFAQAIHNAGDKRAGPFIPVNCASMPPGLIQSELFGYNDGAFTGARRGGQAGKFELAHGGTLFLDEIGDMPLDMQANLLRVLQEKTVLRVGGKQPVPVDVRIIAATNKNLFQEVQKGNFREDLYYRINILPITIPPLRERVEDIELLARYFLTDISSRQGKKMERIDPQAIELLSAHNWPGNIRELINVLEQAVIISGGDIIKPEHIPQYLIKQDTGIETGNGKTYSIKPLKKVEKNAIQEALDYFQGNISRTARALGIGRNTLYEKIKKHKIDI